MAPKRKNRRSRRRPNKKQMHVEYIPFSVKLGDTANVTMSNLNVPPHHTFRCIKMTTRCDRAYVPAPANDSSPGYYCPAAIQIDFLDPVVNPSSGPITATSGAHTLTSGSNRVTVYVPKSTDWSPSATSSDANFFAISAVCLGKPGNAIEAFVRGIAVVVIELKREILATSCPALLGSGDDTKVHRNLGKYRV